MVNKQLGSRVIHHGENEIQILFSNRAIADAEKIMGKGIIGVLRGFNSGDAGISEVAALLQAGMEAARRFYRLGGRRITLNDAFDLLDEIGFTALAPAVFEAIGEVISYESDEFSDEADSDEDPEKN